MWPFLLVAALFVVVVLVAWRLRRYHRDVAVEPDRGYEGPPPFHGQAGPH